MEWVTYKIAVYGVIKLQFTFSPPLKFGVIVQVASLQGRVVHKLKRLITVISGQAQGNLYKRGISNNAVVMSMQLINYVLG